MYKRQVIDCPRNNLKPLCGNNPGAPIIQSAASQFLAISMVIGDHLSDKPANVRNLTTVRKRCRGKLPKVIGKCWQVSDSFLSQLLRLLSVTNAYH